MDLLAVYDDSDSDSDSDEETTTRTTALLTTKEESSQTTATATVTASPSLSVVRSAQQQQQQQQQHNNKARISGSSSVRIIEETSSSSSHLFVRTTPHINGNWSGHVFVPLVDDLKGKQWWHKLARQTTERFRQKLQKKGWSGGSIVPHYEEPKSTTKDSTVVGTNNHLHLSLSRPFFLQLASIPSFVSQLQQRLSRERGTMLAVFCHGQDEKILVNDEKTRSFCCWPLSTNASIVRIVSHIDAVLKDYQQPTYYNPPEFHISVASVPGDISELLLNDDNDNSKGETTTTTSLCDEEKDSSCDDEDEDEDEVSYTYPSYIHINRVYCSFGTTKLYRIDLLPPR